MSTFVRLDNFAVLYIIANILRQQLIERVKMNTNVDIILGECESIIAETENVTEFLTDIDSNTLALALDSFFDELLEIRSSAEELQSLVLQFEEGFTTKEQLDDESINLYQNIKYSLEGFEDEYFDSMSDDVAKSFSYIRASVNTIRSIVVEM